VAVWTERSVAGPVPSNWVVRLMVPLKLETPFSVIVAVSECPGCYKKHPPPNVTEP